MDEYLPIEEATERFNSKSGWPEDKRIDAERLLVHAIEGGLPLYAIVMRTISTDEIAPRPLYRAASCAPVHPKAAERVLLSNPSPAAIREVEVDGAMQPTLEWDMRMGDLRIRAEDIDGLIERSRNGAPAEPVEVSHGETPSESREPEQETDEPKMRFGSNPATAYKPWIAWQARKLVRPSDTYRTLSARIKEIADEHNYRNQSCHELSIDVISKGIPEGTTGGRAKNGRESPKT